MDFTFSDEQEELRRVVRQFLDDKVPELELRRVMATDEGYDADVWRQMAEQVGLQGLAIPEKFGGSGYSSLELAVVFEELGASLAGGPFFATVGLAASALLAAGDDEVAARYLPGIASGETIATFALTEDGASWDRDGVRAAAVADGDRWRVTGAKQFVIDGHHADLVVVAARSGDEIVLLAVDGAAAGATTTLLSTVDATRKLASVHLDGCEAVRIDTQGDAWPAIERTLDLAAVFLAAEQVGGAQRCLDLAVGYAKDRHQFGQPIGTFQAIKHKCADMLIAVEAARSAAYYAAWCAAEGNDELAAAASVAKAFCSEAYFRVAADNIQIHGGIGFTAEHPAHLYYKRAKASELLFGDASHHRELVAQRLAI